MRRYLMLMLLGVMTVSGYSQDAAAVYGPSPVATHLGTHIDANNPAVHAATQHMATQHSEIETCADPWARFHGFIFRRYAGSVEMESKTPYPDGYFGRYTYLPWKPDWVRTPANAIHASQYRHHARGHANAMSHQLESPAVLPPHDHPGHAPFGNSYEQALEGPATGSFPAVPRSSIVPRSSVVPRSAGDPFQSRP